jgi:pantothenate kinase
MSYEYSPRGEMPTFDGLAWIANIYDNHHNLICEVMNLGDGGGNAYKWHSEEGMKALVLNAHEDFVGSMEPLDEFVHALWLDEFAGFSKPEEDLF